MLEKLLKEHIDKCYNWAKDHAKTWRDIENFRGQAYGALMFCINNDLVDYDDAVKYWDIMWNKFFDLNDNLPKEQATPILWRPAQRGATEVSAPLVRRKFIFQ